MNHQPLKCERYPSGWSWVWFDIFVYSDQKDKGPEVLPQNIFRALAGSNSPTMTGYKEYPTKAEAIKAYKDAVIRLKTHS